MNHIQIIILSLALYSCGTPSSNQDIIEDEKVAVAYTDLTDHPGYTLYKTYCIVCHGGTSGPEQRLAPPAFMVKDHYKSFEKEEFITRVTNWIENPNEESSLMPGAIRNFKLMPPLPLPLEDRQKIAEYFFLTEFEEPAWAAEHMRQNQQKKGKN